MAILSGSKFSLTLPQDIIIKLEAEKETIGIKSRSKMIEKCIRYYFDYKKEEKTLRTEMDELRDEIEKMKEKIYLI